MQKRKRGGGRMVWYGATVGGTGIEMLPEPFYPVPSAAIEGRDLDPI